MARPRTYLNAALPPITGGGSLPTHDAELRPLIRLQTLGAATILVGDTRLTVAAGTLFSLLLRLTSASGMQLSREVLRNALWPDQDDNRQRANLRQSLYKLRGYGVRVSLHGDTVQVDATQVLRTFAFDRTSETFDRDVTLGHEPFGAFLPGFSVPWPEFQEWLEVQRESVHAEVRRVLVDQLRRRRDRADWAGADALARWLLQFDPLNEEATLTVAECMALAGSKKEAVAMLDRYLGELGPQAGDLRLQATMLRRRIVEPASRGRVSFAPTERHFVGREEELAALTLSMRRARWHDGSAVLLHGAPGIGKSRLASELEKVAVIEGVRVVRTSCRESDLQRPMSVFLDFVPEWLSMSGALGCAPESLVALRRLVPHERTASDVLFTREEDVEPSSPAIPPLGASRLPEPAPVHVSPHAMPMVSSIRRAILDLVAAVSDEKPMLVIVDDVHWIDEHSWEVLADLIERTSAMRVFMLLTSREPHARPMRPQRVPHSLQLRSVNPLSVDSCVALSRAIGADLSAPVSDELGKWFVRASEGIPLFLRALVHHWIETGEAGGVPPTLRGVIEQRLSQLSGASLHVLQVAVILGKWASPDRVMRVLELRSNEMLQCLEQLDKLSSFVPSISSIISVHELLGKTAVDLLSPVAKGTMHRCAATELWRELASFSDLEVLVETLEHLEAAGDDHAFVVLVLAELNLIANIGIPNVGLRLVRKASMSPVDAHERARLSRAAARLMLLAGEYSKAIADPLRGELLPSVDAELNDDDAESALTLIDTMYRADSLVDRDALGDVAVAIAEHSHLSRRTRLRAADIGLIIMSNQCDPARSARLINAVSISKSDIEFDDSCRNVSLVYHAIFGDREKARDIAMMMYERARGAIPSAQSYHEALRAGFALRLVDSTSIHLEPLQLAYTITDAVGIPSHGLNASFAIAQAHLELGDRKQFLHWVSMGEDLYGRIDEPVACNYAVALFCRRAIEEGEQSIAREIFGRFCANQPRLPADRAAAYTLGLQVAIELLDDAWQPNDALLAALEGRFKKVAPFGTCDFLGSVLLECLLRRDEVKRARAALSHYTNNQRREVSRLGHRLSKVAARIAAV